MNPEIAEQASTPQFHQKLGFYLGPTLAGLVQLSAIDGLSPVGMNMLSVGVLMAVWWASEALPIAVTSLVPLVLMPVLGVATMPETAARYMNPISFLFFGGFTMALAIERCGLHRRIALLVLNLVGLSTGKIIAGIMGVAAFISMWISNTSTTLMLIPSALAISTLFRQHFMDQGTSEKQISNFDVSMFLGLAYGATLGGLGTLVGTPPNAFAAGYVQTQYGIELDFVNWMLVGVPLTLIMLPIVWLVLTQMLYPVNFSAPASLKNYLATSLNELGALKSAEKRVLAIFLFMVAAWLTRKPLMSALGISGVSDASIALLATFALFIIPSGEVRPSGETKGEKLISWADMSRIPWGVLLLFGGGFALANGMSVSGLSAWIGGQLAPLGTAGIAMLIFATCALVIFLTEITTNLATTSTLLPVVAAMSLEMNLPPLMLIVTVTLATSFAFMFPVATAPNAIVFGSGKINITQMFRAGIVLNLISIGVLTLFAIYVIPKIMI